MALPSFSNNTPGPRRKVLIGFLVFTDVKWVWYASFQYLEIIQNINICPMVWINSARKRLYIFHLQILALPWRIMNAIGVALPVSVGINVCNWDVAITTTVPRRCPTVTTTQVGTLYHVNIRSTVRYPEISSNVSNDVFWSQKDTPCKTCVTF